MSLIGLGTNMDPTAPLKRYRMSYGPSDPGVTAAKIRLLALPQHRMFYGVI